MQKCVNGPELHFLITYFLTYAVILSLFLSLSLSLSLSPSLPLSLSPSLPLSLSLSLSPSLSFSLPQPTVCHLCRSTCAGSAVTFFTEEDKLVLRPVANLIKWVPLHF